MILDALPFLHGINLVPGSHLKKRSIASFIDFLEGRLGVKVYFDTRHLPLAEPTLLHLNELVGQLHSRKILLSLTEQSGLPDEPPLKMWNARYGENPADVASGASFLSASDALLATVAEGLERHVWRHASDHFQSLSVQSVAQMARRKHIVHPERFAGFTTEQRALSPNRELKDDQVYTWVQGVSLVSRSSLWIPAQMISGTNDIRIHDGQPETRIRPHTTTGLATWPTLEGARLAGIRECIERDAYMIWWLNQIVAPRIDIQKLCETDAALAHAVKLCERYGLIVHALSLPTDAPTHVLCVVLEESRTASPRYTFGLKAHSTVARAVEGALLESLRARQFIRKTSASTNTPLPPVLEIGHRDRLHYWARPENAERLSVLLSSKTVCTPNQSWEGCSATAHLELLIAWCKHKSYECISVSLGKSKLNPTPWKIEMIVMPDLQPTYLFEKDRAWGGTRLHEVPRLLGYTPLQQPFGESPHPFS